MNKIIKKIFTLAVTLCLGVLPMLAQNAKTGQADKILNGIVIGSDGDTPLAGVVIHSKENPKEIATTDAHGEYKFSVSPTTETVVFEMMGYDTKEIKVADTYLFTLVTMIVQANALEESVVVGFGTQKKESLVGAVQAVKPADLATSSSNLTTSFAGNIPGLIARQTSGEPGADGAAFYIRGISTFGANSSALIVLDGVEITSSMLNNIPTEAIESMSVLKDATATALYGSRGANGVLIVTTKEGRNSEKIAISASFDNTVSMPTIVQEVADGVQYMELYNEALYNVARQSGAAYVPFYSSEKIEGTRNHLDPYVYPNNDWYGMLFKDFAMNQRFNVSLRGGGKKVNYFLNEMFGTLVLVFGALCCLSLAWGKQDYAAASIVVGFIVWGLVTSMGGPTGPGLNPARDLMPRLLHAILPIPHKGSSRWGEAWIPVVAPIVGAIIGAWLFVFFFAS